MSGLESLPPDQRAVLQLVLGQQRSYAEIAGMLKMEPDAVRARALAAADALTAGNEGRPPTERRAEILDYLLGQHTDDDGARAYLAGSDSARAYAWGLVPELAPLGALAEIPAEPEAEAEAEAETAPEPEPFFASPASSSASRTRRVAPRPSSRLGGALLLAGLAVVVAVVLVLVLSGGDDGKKKGSGASTGTTTQPVSTEAQINLSPAHEGSKALGVAQILRQNGVRAMAMIGQDLEPTTAKSFYAVWLYNSLHDAVRLGFTPAVGADKKLQALLPKLPDNASRFKELILTRETQQNPKQPGQFVLRGPLSLTGS